MNIKNHEKKVETSVCFQCKSSKDCIHPIILEKRSKNVLNIKKKNNEFTICDVAGSYKNMAITHMLVLCMCFLEVEFISKSAKNFPYYF